jgi:DNA-binding transcriptional LysR family regulator
MNIDWFKDLQVIEQTGSFSKASGLRNISQPASTYEVDQGAGRMGRATAC